MNSPLQLSCRPLGRSGDQCFIEISVTHELAVWTTFNRLMKVDVIGKRLERGPDLGSRTNLERIAQVDLANPNAGAAQSLQSLARSFVFDGQVTAIVIDPEMLVQAE